MNGPSHMAAGTAAAIGAVAASQYLGFGPEFPAWSVIPAVMIGRVAGLIPDMDEPNSMINRGGWMPRFGPFRGLIKLIGLIVSIPMRALGYLLKGTLGHRGGTHSLSMAIAFSLLIAILTTTTLGTSSEWIPWTVFFGYLSHLLTDSMTRHGVPWLWPLLPKERCFRIVPKAIAITTTQPPQAREVLVKNVCTIVTFVGVAFLGFAVPIMNGGFTA